MRKGTPLNLNRRLDDLWIWQANFATLNLAAVSSSFKFLFSLCVSVDCVLSGAPRAQRTPCNEAHDCYAAQLRALSARLSAAGRQLTSPWQTCWSIFMQISFFLIFLLSASRRLARRPSNQAENSRLFALGIAHPGGAHRWPASTKARTIGWKPKMMHVDTNAAGAGPTRWLHN